jgi:hypothetical protein
MANEEASEIITRLGTVQSIDTARAAGDPFKLPAFLRADVDADRTALLATDLLTAPAEGARASASGMQKAAFTELVRQLRGGWRYIGAIDETTITEPQRLGVFNAYGWQGGEIGRLDDQERILALARLAASVTAAQAGNAAWLYTAERKARIATQLAIITGAEDLASGAGREMATHVRDTALETARTTLLRVRFYYCCASRDADKTPELARIGYQPRRDPGEVDHGGGPQKPPAPAGLTFTQENAGDAVVVDGPALAAGATLAIFAKLVGASGEPVQVGATMALPTAITGIAPGDYEMTAKVTIDGVASDPSTPVPLTVL